MQKKNRLYRFLGTCFLGIFKLLYRHKVYGKRPVLEGQRAMIAANHASYIDPPLVGVSWPEEIFFIARHGLFTVPILGSAIAKLNTVPVVQGKGNRALLRTLEGIFAKERKVVIFPEGQRTLDGEFCPASAGIGLMAALFHCPVIPVYVHGTFAIWRRGQKLPKLWGKTACVFGSPIFPKDFSGLDAKPGQQAFADEVMRRISLLKEWYLKGAKGPLPC